MEHIEITLRDRLAIDRTKLANQRTLLAMLRTGLYLIIMSLTILSLPALKDMKWLSGIIMSMGFITGIIRIILWKNQSNKIKNSYTKMPAK